ncbi:protein adenylyltransferase SelO family protein [Oceanospirillum sediminis]|uniref:Protein nucleotidyltransferase YdiU n=1 Tax=Oceanospirillum sediminis TaxID=2760088 RepID=A0A839IS36_9GAMM|nr:YdiU family protein [Oceanospirillum sediminis]MBB1487006.1 YdiU family protein [Oceanospirillum sediminis]
MNLQPALTDLMHLRLDNSYARLPEHFYHRIEPVPLDSAHLISINSDVARLLELDPSALDYQQLTDLFSGQLTLAGSEPLAMKYAGHQFGVYNPQLGDGRGLLLGEVVTGDGERWDLHLKGSGQTRYSRFGDGRAVLRSSIREYLVSAAMQGLGIPTTQALCLVGSDQTVIRDGLAEPCATLLRVTRCHIRFGHFEHFYHNRQLDELKQLNRYCLQRYFPEYLQESNPSLTMLNEVIKRSARLVALWQAYGFVHGVMNTDNMSLIGETLDYGPYQFMDQYKQNTISNRSDHQGRYAFNQQPDVMHWNLYCLAQCFIPLVHKDPQQAKALLEAALGEFNTLYAGYYYQIMSRRLGLTPIALTGTEDLLPLTTNKKHQTLIDDLTRLLESQQTDLTLMVRLLSETPIPDQIHNLQTITPRPQAFEHWLHSYHQHLQDYPVSDSERQMQMLQVNPVFLLRNYMAQEAIEQAHQGNFTLINDLLPVLRQPYQQHHNMARFAGPAPDWASGIGLSCSS